MSVREAMLPELASRSWTIDGLARHLGMSRHSVRCEMDKLRDEGIVECVKKERPGQRGRYPNSWRIRHADKNM